MLPFVLLLYILRANGVVVPVGVMCVSWLWWFFRCALRLAAVIDEVAKDGRTGKD